MKIYFKIRSLTIILLYICFSTYFNFVIANRYLCVVEYTAIIRLIEHNYFIYYR